MIATSSKQECGYSVCLCCQHEHPTTIYISFNDEPSSCGWEETGTTTCNIVIVEDYQPVEEVYSAEQIAEWAAKEEAQEPETLRDDVPQWRDRDASLVRCRAEFTGPTQHERRNGKRRLSAAVG